MQVWNVLYAARCKYRTQKSSKICHVGTIAQKIRHISTIGKKTVKKQYLLHMSSQYGELRPTSGWDQFGSLEQPSKLQRVSRLGSVTAAASLNGSQPNFARCLAVSWVGTRHYTFSGVLAPLRNFARCKIQFAFKSCAVVFWRYCMALQQRASANLCGVEHRAPPIFGISRATITLEIGPHSSFSLFYMCGRLAPADIEIFWKLLTNTIHSYSKVTSSEQTSELGGFEF